MEGDPAAQQQFLARWSAYREAFLKAFDYLRVQFSVLGPGFLPSVNMLATLAVFFYLDLGDASGTLTAKADDAQ
jgi:hypothetical protein